MSSDPRLDMIEDRLILEEAFRKSADRQIQEQIDTLNGACNDINERLDELTGLLSALQAQAVEGADVPELTPEEDAALDGDGWTRMDTGAPVADPADVTITGSGADGVAGLADEEAEEAADCQEFHEVITRLQRAYYAGAVPVGAWARVAGEVMTMKEEAADEAVNRAVDQTVDHCKTIRRLQAELDAMVVGKRADPVPRVGVVDICRHFRVNACVFCVSLHTGLTGAPCKSCSLYLKELEPDELPSNFELREDLG